MLSYVVNKQQRLSPKLARALWKKRGLPVEGQPRQNKPPATAALAG
jgi:hypothetical protein